MSNQVKTVAETVKDKEIPMIGGTQEFDSSKSKTRELVPRTLYGIEVANLNIDPIYQRTIDLSNIKKYGQLNPQWLTAAILAQRPDGSLYIIDGQNKACLYFRSSEKNIGFHCLVYVHDKYTSVGNCRKIEAEIYKNINENLKSLTTLQKIRSGVVFEDPESCWVERVMRELNLTLEGFGSQKKDALQVFGFNQFFIMVTKFFPEGKNELISVKKIDRMLSGLDLYKRMWAGDPILTQGSGKKKPGVYGNILKGCVLVHEFQEDVLENGKSITLDNYLQWKNFSNTNTKIESKVIGGDGYSARRFLHMVVLDRLPTYITNNNLKGAGLIGPKVHARAESQFGQKFTDPRIDSRKSA